ncbi:ribonuclease H-like domain-containing protein [Lachnoclostridium phytofermentans]|uniref:Exonuclease-like protein n=1 Tax=Lachnoclostridium phytofermentans (strain ATCC 700394 / DSM 18823 / ISDg) TaxID=357809 RepID=A9KNV6_LACP7|nr:ribonuclease H-like domain-containing protein [Lachnoclostridium phytofermentans]ABX41707.1 exonuclease-like protein [Lachnoclostridium phytofermentans ISDg]
MQIIETPIKISFDFDLTMLSSKHVSNQEILFFDIETTGFSASMSYVYLIGCAYFDQSTFVLRQWFMEDIREEKELLTNFFEFIKSYRLLVHYNGSGFDIPYLLQKCSTYQLSYNFEHIISFDIYKQLIPYKKILPTKNLKLKTVEDFLKVERKDQYSGGELISVFTKFLALYTYERKHTSGASHYQVSPVSGLPSIEKSDSGTLRQLLLLHNAEDISNLPRILPMLSFVKLFEGNITLNKWNVNDQTVNFYFQINNQLPTSLKLESNYEVMDSLYPITLIASENEGCISIDFYHGSLKFYFDNYKDYYYLPLEDTAVHKSVGEYVEKEYRQNAKPDTCYIKKTGQFLPQPYAMFTPSFRMERKQKQQFFEFTEQLLEQNSEKIVSEIIRSYF